MDRFVPEITIVGLTSELIARQVYIVNVHGLSGTHKFEEDTDIQG